MKKFLEIIFGRAIFLLTAFFLQIIAIIFIVAKFQEYFVYFYVLSIIISILLLLFLISSNMNPAYKIAWIVPIMLFPAFGWIFYILFSGNRFTKVGANNSRKYYTNSLIDLHKILTQNNFIMNELKENSPVAYGQAKYLEDFGQSPVFINSESKYFEIGEEYFKSLLEELEKAEKFIFMEYFIISKGEMWNSILEVLKRKVKQGVEVRLIYDDFGCIMTLPRKYNKELESYGIKCLVFNPVNPVFTIIYNNRTHRKITVIDGKIAFTGGINLADEYINKLERFGHWKDTGIFIKGEGAWSFTVMFLNIWNFIGKTTEDYSKYKVDISSEYNNQKDGYVIPFSDSPLDKEIVSSNIYISLINNAKEYVYINTPYLIIDYEMTSALCYAAKRGIDVRIVTPNIPDKKAVFEVTRSNYLPLIEAGVKIYEYKPGFIHAKSFVVDDLYAVVGTINLDYRSLYLHFECGVWIYNSKTIFDIKNDYLITLEKCHNFTLEECKNISGIRELLRSILKVFAPLM